MNARAKEREKDGRTVRGSGIVRVGELAEEHALRAAGRSLEAMRDALAARLLALGGFPATRGRGVFSGSKALLDAGERREEEGRLLGRGGRLGGLVALLDDVEV